MLGVKKLGIAETRGIVTKEVKYKDTDRIITVLTEDFGKISAIAKGVRNKKAGLLAGTQLFSYSKFVMFIGGEKRLYQINEIQTIETFSPLRQSLEDMAYASYFCDIANSFINENLPDTEMLSLLLNTLYLLSNKKMSATKLKAAYIFRALSIAGFAPDLNLCRSCGKNPGTDFLSLADGVGLCKECGVGLKQVVPLSTGISEAIQYISSADANKVFSFNLSDEALLYLGKIGDSYLSAQTDRNFKTLEYLNKVLSL